MGVNIQEYSSNRILGNVKIGAKNSKEYPVNYGYFNVHIDKMTSSLAVELFNSVYDKPQKLKIKFVNQNPIDLHLERYLGNRRMCYGNNREAICIDENGKKSKIPCNDQKCQYAIEKKCKMIGRLYFLLDKLEDEGIWCYPTGNQKGIDRILKRIIRANRLGYDLTKDWYELFLTPTPSAYKGMEYIPDIRPLNNMKEETSSKNELNKDQKSSDSSQSKINYLMITGFEKCKVNNEDAMKIIFKDTQANVKELFLLPKSNQTILSLKQKSIILPVSISTRENISILNDYQIIKRAS